MINLAVFDLDGTLLDTVPDLTAAMNYAMDRMRRPRITVEQGRAYIGNGIKKFAERALRASYECGEPGEEADEAVGYFKLYYADHLTDHTRPYPGIEDQLSKLRAAGIKLAVLSNKYDSATAFIIDRFFPHVFECVYGESEICKRKPDPAGLLLISEKTGADLKNTVMIGDSVTDVQVALAVGAHHIAVEWGYRKRSVLEAGGARVFAPSPDCLFDIITSL